MKIQEIYTLLFENYDSMANAYYEALQDPIVPRTISEQNRMLPNVGKRLGFNGSDIIEVYASMVRKNAKIMDDSEFVKNPKNAGEWIRAFRQFGVRAVADFQAVIRESLVAINNRQEEKEGEKEYEVVGRGQGFIIFKPEHRAAACKLGSNTKWCISSRSNNYFDDYSKDNDIYIIHAQTEKFAILVDSISREVTEVQFSENEYSHPDSIILKDFVRRMKEAGVDVEKVSEVIGTQLVQVEKWLESFDLVMTGNVEEYNGWKIAKYEPRYNMKDSTGRSWDNTIPGTLLGEIEDPKGEKYYAWLNSLTNAGVKLWKVAAYNGEVKAPYDPKPLNDFIRKLHDGFEDRDIDPMAVSIGYDSFTTLNNEIRQGVK